MMGVHYPKISRYEIQTGKCIFAVIASKWTLRRAKNDKKDSLEKRSVRTANITLRYFFTVYMSSQAKKKYHLSQQHYRLSESNNRKNYDARYTPTKSSRNATSLQAMLLTNTPVALPPLFHGSRPRGIKTGIRLLQKNEKIMIGARWK